MRAGQLTAQELMQAYCCRLYEGCRNYEEVARRLDVDRRTVRKYVQGALRSKRAGKN